MARKPASYNLILYCHSLCDRYKNQGESLEHLPLSRGGLSSLPAFSLSFLKPSPLAYFINYHSSCGMTDGRVQQSNEEHCNGYER
jgi:hypothetical protein